jgi:hypothetical protein
MHRIDLGALSAYLAKRQDVVFAVVFGSGQDGRIRDKGDLDLGVLFRGKPSPESLIRFMTEIAEAVDFDAIDLVDLHDADPILAFEAISGRLISRNDPGRTAEFVSLVSRLYEDTMARLSRAA